MEKQASYYQSDRSNQDSKYHELN